MIPPFLLPYLIRFAVVLVMFLAGLGFGYVKGLHHAEAEHQLFVSAVDNAATAQAVKTGAREAANKQATQDVEDEYKGKLDAVRNYYAAHPNVVRLHDPAAKDGSGALPGVPPAASESDAGAAYDGLVAEYNRLAEACAETTQQVLSWQEWAIKQGAKP